MKNLALFLLPNYLLKYMLASVNQRSHLPPSKEAGTHLPLFFRHLQGFASTSLNNTYNFGRHHQFRLTGLPQKNCPVLEPAPSHFNSQLGCCWWLLNTDSLRTPFKLNLNLT